MSVSRGPFPPQPFTNDYSLQGDPPIGSCDPGSSGAGGCDDCGGLCLNLISKASAPPPSLSVTMSSARHIMASESSVDPPPPRCAVISSHSAYAHQISESHANISQMEPYPSLERNNLVDNFYPSSAPPDASHYLVGFNVSLHSLLNQWY